VRRKKGKEVQQYGQEEKSHQKTKTSQEKEKSF